MIHFEKILNHYKDSIGKQYSKVIRDYRNKKVLLNQDEDGFDKWLSINDLISPNSGFMQAVKWKSTDNGDINIVKNVTAIGTLYGDYEDYFGDDDWRYHSMMLSILPDKEKIKYLEDNIIIDD